MPRPPKTLILCFDGTSNSFNDENTNIVRIFSALEKNDPDLQMCYYQPGIGTYVAPNSVWSPTLQSIAKVLDAGVAWYLDAHIMGGYRFLMDNFQPGDKICLFGFSRGAYTARCLAGMLHKVGLLPKSNEEQIAFAYKKYTDTTPNGKLAARGFKAAFSRDVEIEFMGVWDTVASVGVFSRHLPFTASNTIIRTFRQALALDEHRAKFKPNPWHRAAASVAAARNDPDKGTCVIPPSARPNFFERISSGMREELERVGDVMQNVMGDVMEGKMYKRQGGRNVLKKRSVKSVDSEAIDDGDDDAYHGKRETDVKEVWFPGCHADVGGGSASNNVTNTLANPSLMWMVNEIIATHAPIFFKAYAFTDIPAFETLTVTLADRTPKHRPQIPSFSGERRDVSQATAVDGYTSGGLPPTPSTSGFTGTASPATTAFNDRGRQPNAPPTPIVEETIVYSPVSPTEGLTIVKVSEDDPKLDANAEMYDQLKKTPAWWILEFIPLWQYYQDRHGHWHKGFYWNRGRPREIQDTNPLFHSSVRLRDGYTPRAKLPRGAVVTYID